MIKTKCLKLPPEPSDNKRFLVTRWWPRPMTRAELRITDWVRTLAPSRELLTDWKKNRMSWEQYVARYTQEMSLQANALACMARLARTETITLLCYEEEGDPHCHRYLLKEMIESRLKELSAKRRDSD